MGIYHVPLPSEYFSAFSVCLDCCVLSALFVDWKFVVPLNYKVCSLMVGLNQWFVKVSWLGALAWCVEQDLFFMECNEVSSSEFWGVCGFGMALGSPSFNVQGRVPVLLGN